MCCVKLLQLCPTLCDPKDCSLPGSSVHGIIQGRILEWAAVPFSRESFPPRDQTHVFCGFHIVGGFSTAVSPGKPHLIYIYGQICLYSFTLGYIYYLSNKIHKDTETIHWDNKLHGHCPRFGGKFFQVHLNLSGEVDQFLILQTRELYLWHSAYLKKLSLAALSILILTFIAG